MWHYVSFGFGQDYCYCVQNVIASLLHDIEINSSAQLRFRRIFNIVDWVDR